MRAASSTRAAELDRVLRQMPMTHRAVLERPFESFADAAGEPPLRDTLVLEI